MLIVGLGYGLGWGLISWLISWLVGLLLGLGNWSIFFLTMLSFGLFWGLASGLLGVLPTSHIARSARLTIFLLPTRQQRRDLLNILFLTLGLGLFFCVSAFWLGMSLFASLSFGGLVGLVGGLVGGVLYWLAPHSLLLPSRTPQKVRSHSLNAALVYTLTVGLIMSAASLWHFMGRNESVLSLYWILSLALFIGLTIGLVAGMNKGGWFVLLQKVAHRRLARDGNLPSPPYDFLEWGVEQQIFRRVGGGVRFRHNLIQQHLANASEGGA